MKFWSLALSTLLAESALAAKSLSGDELNNMLRSGKVDTKSLLRSAIPYEKDRKLSGDEDQGNYYETYGYLGNNGITGDHSVTFNSCVSLAVEEEWDTIDNFDEDFEVLVQKELVQSVRNYVLFNVCSTMGDCDSAEASEQNTYMVDLNTWVASMLDYFPNSKDDYCEGCLNQQDYCQSMTASQEEGIDYSRAAFFYDETKFQLVNCKQCYTYGCYNDQDVYEENGWDEVSEWVEQFTECVETGYQWGDFDLSAAWMCNKNGNGMELAMFLDDECTLYNSQVSYYNYIEQDSEEWDYYGRSQSIIGYLFSNQFDCYGGDTNYVNMYQQVYIDENGQYDPCATTSSGYYLNYQECQNLKQNNPCYASYYGYEVEGDGEGDGEGEGEGNGDCAQFMEEYPCWSMPGESVAQEYEEACEEYMAEFSHEANEVCENLFAGRGGGNSGDGLAMEAMSLSACAYQHAAEYNGEQNQNQEENQEGEEEDQYAWMSYMTYDITQEMMEEGEYAACYYVDTLFTNGAHLNSQVYDPDTSGSMYDYENVDEGSSNSGNSNKGNGFFPTVPSMNLNKSARAGRSMSGAGIAARAFLVAIGAFALSFVAFKIQKRIGESEIEEGNHADQKETPLMT